MFGGLCLEGICLGGFVWLFFLAVSLSSCLVCLVVCNRICPIGCGFVWFLHMSGCEFAP